MAISLTAYAKTDIRASKGNADYPSQAFREDTYHEYAGKILFRGVCRAQRSV